MPNWLIGLGAIVILVLVCVAAWLHWQLHLQRKKLAAWEKETADEEAKSQSQARQSIVIICRSYIAGQVECGEASIRISHLFDRLELEKSTRDHFLVFDKVREALDHIPILQQWKALDKKTKKQHLKTIAKVEHEFNAFALDSAKNLLQHQAFKTEQ